MNICRISSTPSLIGLETLPDICMSRDDFMLEGMPFDTNPCIFAAWLDSFLECVDQKSCSLVEFESEIKLDVRRECCVRIFRSEARMEEQVTDCS